LRALPGVRDDELAAQRARNRLVEAFANAPQAPGRGRVRWILAGGAVAATAAATLVFAIRTPTPAMPTGPAIAADPIRIDAEHARWSRVDDGARTTVRLDDGDVRIHVDHAGTARQLIVIVPDGTLEDIGTTFFVSVRAGRTAEVAVEDGRLSFHRDHDPPVLLASGEHWVAREAAATPSPPPPAAAITSPKRVAPKKPIAPATPPRASTPDRELRDAIAKLDAGDAVAASRMLRTILDDDPGSEDAAYLLVIALQRAADLDGARLAARAYLQRFPDGFRRDSVEPIAR
jgi:hypothetical protein